MSFVFSADGHIVEPTDMYTEGLPPSLRAFGLRAEKEGDYIFTRAGERITSRIPIHKPLPTINGEDFGRNNRKGAKDFESRLADLELEGIDAEIIFPTLGLTSFLIENPEAELATAQIWNDWIHKQVGHKPETFVRCAILPVQDFRNTITEMKRVAQLGFTAAMLPSLIDKWSGLPPYNDEEWDAVFEAGQSLGLAFVCHTGTGREDVRSTRGAGGAVVNYTIQACDGMITIMHMVAGGVLDRFPGAQVCFVEGGASWLAGLAERMDEVYDAHEIFVRPKLSLKPSEIIARQISCSFQYDRACVMSRSVTGTKALMWGSDYPHHEGTFPNSRAVREKLFEGIEISERDKADIIGGNAGRLFRVPRPEFQNAA